MTYYVAESIKRPSDKNRYICMADNMKHRWFSSVNAIDPANLIPTDDYTPTMTVQEWIAVLPKHRMRLLFSFTEQSHPEFFI